MVGNGWLIKKYTVNSGFLYSFWKSLRNVANRTDISEIPYCKMVVRNSCVKCESTDLMQFPKGLCDLKVSVFCD